MHFAQDLPMSFVGSAMEWKTTGLYNTNEITRSSQSIVAGGRVGSRHNHAGTIHGNIQKKIILTLIYT